MAVLTDTSLVISRLANLGLTEPILRDAVLAGELERISCTKLHPKSHPGFVAWGTTVAKLAEHLVPAGWHREEPNNLPLVVDPIRKVAIVVSSGNGWTGHPAHDPTTEYPKGTGFKVNVVGTQLRLFGDSRQWAPSPPLHEVETWLLLVYAADYPRSDNGVDHVAKCELSLPSRMDEKGYVTAWAERIILEPVPMDEVPLKQSEPSGQQEEEPAVTVTRR